MSADSLEHLGALEPINELHSEGIGGFCTTCGGLFPCLTRKLARDLFRASREAGIAEGRRQATEGWEREWGAEWVLVSGEPTGNVDVAAGEAEARRNAAEWHDHRPVSRLVGPWEPAEVSTSDAQASDRQQGTDG